VARNLFYFGCDHCFVDQEEKTAQNFSELLKISTPGDGIILISFGTVTRGDQIPPIQLQRLISTFAKFPSYTFVWQLDVTRDYFTRMVLEAIDMRMPTNVHLFSWIPLRKLLADRNVILLINHGGVSTCSEALHNGVPVLGIALQGDQGYNLQRIVDKGLGEMLSVSELTDQNLYEKLSTMINGIDKYKKAAMKLRSMTRDYRSLHKRLPSTFWIGWTARHFGQGRNATNTARLAKRFLILRHTWNWFIHYSLDVLIAPIFFIALFSMIIFARLYKINFYKRRVRFSRPLVAKKLIRKRV